MADFQSIVFINSIITRLNLSLYLFSTIKTQSYEGDDAYGNQGDGNEGNS
jgi:hypothetical protein